MVDGILHNVIANPVASGIRQTEEIGFADLQFMT